MSGKDWGQSLETQRPLHASYIRGPLEYASHSWWAWIPETSRTKLERVQNAALRSITGLYQKCPLDFLCLETNVEPLRNRMCKNDRISLDKYSRLHNSDQQKQLLDQHVPQRLQTRKGWRSTVLAVEPPVAEPSALNPPLLPPWKHLNNLTVDAVHLEKKKSEYTQTELRTASLAKIDSMMADFIIYTDGDGLRGGYLHR